LARPPPLTDARAAPHPARARRSEQPRLRPDALDSPGHERYRGGMSAAPSIESELSELFAAERNVRRLHESLCDRPEGELVEAVVAAIATAAQEPDEAEAALRLVRLAAILGEFEGPRVVDALVDILGSDHEEARRAAGEELEALAFERFKEVAEGFERAYKRL